MYENGTWKMFLFIVLQDLVNVFSFFYVLYKPFVVRDSQFGEIQPKVREK